MAAYNGSRSSRPESCAGASSSWRVLLEGTSTIMFVFIRSAGYRLVSGANYKRLAEGFQFLLEPLVVGDIALGAHGEPLDGCLIQLANHLARGTHDQRTVRNLLAFRYQ